MSPEPAASTRDDSGLDATLANCRLAHRRLQTTLGRLDDELARAPSRLAGWSVGHVLTHLACNADSHVRILLGALADEHREQYPGGWAQRYTDIEAGAGRAAQALVEDVVGSAAWLEEVWAAIPPDAWDGHGLSRGRPWPCRELVFHRWREVEVHHVDLGLGYEVTDWPEPYVTEELPRALAALPDRLDDPAERSRVLAWLLDRAEQPGALQLEPWQSRPEHYFTSGARA